MKIRKVAQTPGLLATVVDNLESDSALDALSAKQGKELKRLIEESPGGGGDGSVTIIDAFPIGAVVEYASNTFPNGWLLCDGSAVSRTEFADLFALIGTTYGSGDGNTTFNLPNYLTRVGVGKYTLDSDFANLGQMGGLKVHQLTIDEMPSHTHNTGVQEDIAGGIYAEQGNTSAKVYWNTSGMSTSSVGGNQPHNNLQPYIVTNYIIKAKQSTNAGSWNPTSTGAPEVSIGSEVPTGAEVLWINEEDEVEPEDVILDKNIMTIHLPSDCSCDTIGAYTIVSGFELVNKIGNRLTFKDDKIVIGKNISKILISGRIGWYCTDTGIKYAYIRVNNSGVVWSTVNATAANVYVSDNFSSYLVDVKEGDTIYLVYYTAQSNDAVVGLGRTYITVEAVA